jgi:hypothetical protein
MKILVLDPRNGDAVTDLYVADPADRSLESMRLQYVPELHFDPAARQLLIVETELDCGPERDGTSYWLRLLDAETLKLVRTVATPTRPMYAGFPNRSTRVSGTPSGRYVYVQELCMPPGRVDIYRTLVHRYDRERNVLERGAPVVDSCVVAFGVLGPGDDELFFHLCCEEPSSVLVARFDSPGGELVRMTELPARKYSLEETCGSWLDAASQSLFCTDRAGAIYRVRRPPEETSLFARLPIATPRTVPLQHIHGADGRLFIGVARSDGERSVSLASEIWTMSIEDAAVMKATTLPAPVINFVTTADGSYLVGVNPYRRALYVVDLGTGKLVDQIGDLGITPAEVQLIP